MKKSPVIAGDHSIKNRIKPPRSSFLKKLPSVFHTRQLPDDEEDALKAALMLLSLLSVMLSMAITRATKNS